jgi:hypothetical protein
LPTPPVTIPAIPTPVPTAADPTNFPARGDAVVAALPNVVDGMNAAATNTYNNALEVSNTATALSAVAAVAADAAGLAAQSTSTLSVDAGTKDIVFTAAKPGLAVVGKRLVAMQISDPSIRMFMTVATAPTTSHITATVVTSDCFGTGSYSGWEIVDAAFLQPAATAAEILAGTTDAAPIAPKGLADSDAFQTLTSAATIAWNLGLGWNAQVTLDGNRTLGAPSGGHDGQVIALDVIQPGSGGPYTLAYNSVFEFTAAGTPVLSTAASKRDTLVFQYRSATTKWRLINFLRAA